MTEGTRGSRGTRTPAESGRMTAEDADRFRVLLARLEDSLAADRRTETTPAARPPAGRDG
ncbi:hypothetical protein ACFP3U_12125 [Kitasatospora misakiensis]|uniref:Uncharacterized protein n=1 Tax=Kitasatospora misakiensis TaxID=67330 RepID=A0ABW0X3E5_9ACTN